MDNVHVSMTSGGAYAVVHAGFWEQLDDTAIGRRFRHSVTSLSGSSAGALVGAAVAVGVPGRAISHDMLRGGLTGRGKYLRALAVYFKLPYFKRSMYSGDDYIRRLKRLCDNRSYSPVPMTVAVTTPDLVQHCIRFSEPDDARLVNAAVASASIPYVLPSRPVGGYGMCVDGSVNRSSLPEDTVVRIMREGSGTLVLLNCLPWPGYRESIPVSRKAAKLLGITRLMIQYGEDLYDHAMERTLDNVIKPKLVYQDGIFELLIDNTSGEPVISDNSNLKIIFVAPTQKHFTDCGGVNMIAKLDYRAGNKSILAMRTSGMRLARDFIDEYGEIRIF